ncbi:MAG: rhodanese-like domain-containing protein [Thermomicrobiales bacterium]|nr:rhodanese-like domain-containing protein [Thermomicrobiales bacterium]
MLRNPFARKDIPEVTVADSVSAIAGGTHQLLDIREQDEWDAYRIPGARFIPLGQLAQRAEELEPERPVIVYCKSGVRSMHAVEILQSTGRKDAASMTGGIIAWYEAGQPIEQ